MIPAHVVVLSASDTPVKLFGEWEERQATSCLVSVEAASLTNALIKYEMRTKNREKEGDGAKPVNSPTVQIVSGESENDPTNPATSGKFDGNLEELVRDYLEVVANESSVPGFAVIRVLPKIWYDAVKA